MQEIASSGFYTINGCGDNRTQPSCLPSLPHSNTSMGTAFAERAGEVLRLPTNPISNLRDKTRRPEGRAQDSEKFRVRRQLSTGSPRDRISAVDRDEKTGEYVPDNCVEVRTDDIGVVPLLTAGARSRGSRYTSEEAKGRRQVPDIRHNGKPLDSPRKKKRDEGARRDRGDAPEWGAGRTGTGQDEIRVYKMSSRGFREQSRPGARSRDAPGPDNGARRCTPVGTGRRPSKVVLRRLRRDRRIDAGRTGSMSMVKP